MTTADELLLEWAKGHFPKWAREKVDRHNRDVASTKAHNERNPDYKRAISPPEIIKAHTLAHISNCGPRISAVDHEWECGCYSEYTRDDSWMIHCNVTCAHGLITDMRVELSPWDMPDVIRELAAMEDGGCPYDDPDYDWDW